MAGPKLRHYFGAKPEQIDVHDKELIEQMKKSIAGKLKDPAMAKKAAQIISEMLEQEQHNSKNQKLA